MIKKYSVLCKKSTAKTPGKIDLKVGKYRIFADLLLDYTVDPNYGANADNLYGIRMEFIDGWEFSEDPIVYDEEKDEDIPFSSLDKDTQKMLEKAIDSNMDEIEVLENEKEYEPEE